MPNLAGCDQLTHRADRLLYRSVAVDPMLVVEVDVVDTQPVERRVARAPDVFGIAADPQSFTARPPYVPELRCNDDGVPTAGDGPPDEPLVRERPVHVGGVEKVHSEI